MPALASSADFSAMKFHHSPSYCNLIDAFQLYACIISAVAVVLPRSDFGDALHGIEISTYAI
jgi:hypothetical protein